MRFLIETWLLLSDELEVAEHTTSCCTLPTNRLLWPSTASQTSPISCRIAQWRGYLATPTSYFNWTCVQTSRVSWQALVHARPCHWWQLHKYHGRCQSELQTVCFPPSSTGIRSLNWRSLHQSLVARTASRSLRKASMTCASSLSLYQKSHEAHGKSNHNPPLVNCSISF